MSSAAPRIQASSLVCWRCKGVLDQQDLACRYCNAVRDGAPKLPVMSEQHWPRDADGREVEE
jgi:hypothetical protein